MDRHTALIGFQQEGSFRHIPQCIRVIMFAEREVKPLPYETLRQFLFPPKAVDNPRLGRMNFFFQGNQFIISLYGMDNQRQAVVFGKRNYHAESFLLQGKRGMATLINPRFSQSIPPPGFSQHSFYHPDSPRLLPGTKMHRLYPPRNPHTFIG